MDHRTQNPDTDSICSAIGYAALKGEGFQAGRAGELSPETTFVLERFGLKAPELVANAQGETIILVDHNEMAQAVDGAAEAKIIEILDHHKLGGLQTSEPILFCNLPVGCTATIVYTFYQAQGKQPEAAVAGRTVLGDSLRHLGFPFADLHRAGQKAALALAAIAGISDVEAYAQEMFKAGSDLSSKTEKEILYLDFKKFTAGSVTFGVGQVTSMSADELASLKQRMQGYMAESFAEHGVDMLFLVLTDILAESSELLCCGEGAEAAARKAFTSAEARALLPAWRRFPQKTDRAAAH